MTSFETPSAHDSHPADDRDDAPRVPGAQPEGLQIPSRLIDAAHEQPVRDGAWAFIVAGEDDEIEVAAEVMLLADGAVDADRASSIATHLLEARARQIAEAGSAPEA